MHPKHLTLPAMILTAFIACSPNPAPKAPAIPVPLPGPMTNQAPKDPVLARNRLVFFMNPNGYPCQRQRALLEDMGATLTDRVKLEYVSTQVPTDLEKFERAGIRGLPTLLLMDEKGNVLHRFPSGVRNSQEILAALGRF